jgi:hypothetical protein
MGKASNMGKGGMGKTPKLKVRDVADIPLREVSGLASGGRRLLAVGDHDPVLFTAALESWPLRWEGVDLAGLDLPAGGVQFEAVEASGEQTVLVLQEQPARVLYIDLSGPTLVGTFLLEMPEDHRLRQGWLGDRSSRGESLLLTEHGHLLIVKEKDPPAILEFGPPGDAPVGWRRGARPTPPVPGDSRLTVLATWWLGDRMQQELPDISDAAVGPDGRIYLLSDQGSTIARLPDVLDASGGTVEPTATWRIADSPRNAEGLVILADGTPLIGLDTKAPRGNLLRLEPLPLVE